jgi:hypothetical protein
LQVALSHWGEFYDIVVIMKRRQSWRRPKHLAGCSANG